MAAQTPRKSDTSMNENPNTDLGPLPDQSLCSSCWFWVNFDSRTIKCAVVSNARFNGQTYEISLRS